jgi:hypothetical protein
MAAGRFLASLAVASLWVSAAHAQLAAEESKLYGGRYAVDCADSTSARVIVGSDAMTVEAGTRRMTGRNLQSSASYYGNSTPPANFRTALMAEVRGNLQLVGLVSTDRDGAYLRFEAGDRQVSAALGPLATARFRDCNAARSQQALAQTASTIAEDKRDQIDHARQLKSAFSVAYRRALGSLVREPWLADVTATSFDRSTSIGGREYRLGAVCKPHDCHDNNMVVVAAPGDGPIYGKVLIANRVSFIGAPPPAVQRELDRLWRAEWRKNG